MYRQRAKENVPLMMVRRSIKVFYHYHLSSHGSGLYTFKGALYRIWCGVNRLGDSGVKVV